MNEAAEASVQGPRTPRAFFGDIKTKFEGAELVMSELTYFRGRRLPTHFHAFSYFTLILAGEVSNSFGRQSAALKQFTTMFHPQGVEHEDRFGPGEARIFAVAVGQSWLERLRELGVRPESAIDVHRGELTWLAMRLYQEYSHHEARSPLMIEGLVLEMLAVLARPKERREKRPAWLSEVLNLLNACYQQNLTVKSIADRVGVHPAYLSRAFRRHFHQTICDYVHKLRIEFALRALTTVDVNLASLAVLSGFADQSHFNRVFKNVTGLTPGAFRRMAGLPPIELRSIDHLDPRASSST